MSIFNFLFCIVALVLFAVLTKRIVKRLNFLYQRYDRLESELLNLSSKQNELKAQVNDVRRSLDNY